MCKVQHTEPQPFTVHPQLCASVSKTSGQMQFRCRARQSSPTRCTETLCLLSALLLKILCFIPNLVLLFCSLINIHIMKAPSFSKDIPQVYDHAKFNCLISLLLIINKSTSKTQVLQSEICCCFEGTMLGFSQ